MDCMEEKEFYKYFEDFQSKKMISKNKKIKEFKFKKSVKSPITLFYNFPLTINPK